MRLHVDCQELEQRLPLSRDTRVQKNMRECEMGVMMS